MEEVDSIIVRQLKEAGCAIDDGKTRLSELEPNDVILCAAYCLSMIDAGDAEVAAISTSNLNMATKYKIGSLLAAKCKQLGFKGDIGYQSFLYGAAAEVRRLFLFLIEKLPKEEPEAAPTAVKKLDIRSRLKRKQVCTTWLPQMYDQERQAQRAFDRYDCKSLAGALNSRSILMNKMAPPRVNYYDNYATAPLDIGSLFTFNAAQLRAGERPSTSRIPVTFQVVQRIEVDQSSGHRDVQAEQQQLHGQATATATVEDSSQSYDQRMAEAVAVLETEFEKLAVRESDTKRRCDQLSEQVAQLETDGKDL